MEGIALFVSIVIIVFGILQIILFFKLWGMTNDIGKIRSIIEKKIQQEKVVKQDKVHNEKVANSLKGTWGKDVSEEEKNMAQSLLPKLMDNEVILLMKGKLVVYDAYSLSELDDYKIIYYK
ncbi:hypothetical protein [uncultured Bacteroides sp.]|uniref:hypothetical protein n=1 Tax=uncultured Bacteroides sp. TaxID=162156 RepID=UPI002675B6CC|nr:hypothetical protein [uncultured Bacteroides sp.]